MKDIVLKLKKPFLKLKDRDHPFWFFCFLFVLALVMSAFTLLTNSGTIPLGGDYVQQEIPFYVNGYDDWWHFFKTGEFPLWDNNSVIGVNNIASNCFYYLLNPFFLPILLVPRSLIPQGLAILMLIKMALAGMTFWAYLKYMGVKEKNARIFAIAYAFCGWNMFYLWFNHFLEICVTFPLIMLGIEKVIKEKKPWLLMVGVFIMGLANYTFLVSSCVAGVIYAIFRFFQTVKERKASDSFKVMGLGFSGFAVGIMMCAFVILPCFMDAQHNPRVEDAWLIPAIKDALKAENWAKVFDLLFKFDHEKKTYYPLVNFFFPVVSDYSNILFNNNGYDNTLGSIFVYTPLIIMFFPSVIESIRKKKISHLIAIGGFILLLFTPFFYWMSFAFAKEYGRWQIFATFAIITYVAMNFENITKWPKDYFDISIATTLVLMGFTIYLCLSVQSDLISKKEINELDERKYVVLYQLIYAVVVYSILRTQFKKPQLHKYLVGLLSLEVIVMGNLIFNIHGTVSFDNLYGGRANSKDEQRIVNNINKDDDDFFRIFNTTANKSTNNLGMYLGYNGLGGFHSAYNYETQDFLTWSHIPYFDFTWTMGDHEKKINLEEFLGVKYYITRNSDYRIYVEDQPTFDVKHINVPYGFKLREDLSTAEHTVFENEEYMPLGFAFDNIIMADKFSVTKSYDQEYIRSEEAYLKGAILYPEDVYTDFIKEDFDNSSDNFTHAQEYYQTLTINEEIADFPLNWNRNYDAIKELTVGKKYECSAPLNPLDPSGLNACSVSSGNNYTYNRTYFELKPNNKKTIAGEASARGGAYIMMRLPMNAYSYVYLYDQNDELITFDYHQYIDSSFKSMRGFYVDRPVSKIIIRPMTNNTNGSTRPIYYSSTDYYVQYYDTYQERLAPLKENAFKNVESSANKHSFDTSYSEKKFIVLNIPYDDGWSVSIQKDDGTTLSPRVYKAHGGFVGFVAPSGNNHIVVSYMTPYLKAGTLVSIIGVTICAGSFGLVYYLKKRKKKKSDEKDDNKEINEEILA